jgi:polyhydroxybutyrate depolymerase
MRCSTALASLALSSALGCHGSSIPDERAPKPKAPSVSQTLERIAPRASASAADDAPPPDVPARQTFAPADLRPGERLPLIVALHGLGASGRVAFDVLGLADFGRRHRVFIVAPDGTLDSAGRRFWNAGDACCNFEHLPVDDVARLGALIERWLARPDIDPRRVYVVGHSNGGFMAHRLACQRSDLIAAVVSVSGAAPPESERCVPSSPVSVLEIHGDADQIVRYTGGSVFDRNGSARFPSAHDTFAGWARRLGCEGPVVRGPDLDLDPALPGAETEVAMHERCARGSVALWTAHGGNHYIGTRPTALERTWSFLESHPKP